MDNINLNKHKCECPDTATSKSIRTGPKTSGLTDTDQCNAILANNSMCNESKTIDILNKYNKIFEKRIDYVERECGRDALEVIHPIYIEWVDYLKSQNSELINLVSELEDTTNEKLYILEKRLNSNAEQVLTQHLESDKNNLIEIIHRALTRKIWSANELKFYTIKIEDIFGGYNSISESVKPPKNESIKELSVNVSLSDSSVLENKVITDLSEKDIKIISEQERQIKRLSGEVNRLSDSLKEQTELLRDDIIWDKEVASSFDELKSISRQQSEQIELLQAEKEGLLNDTRHFKKLMDKAKMDKRVLVNEVAAKHDEVLQYKSELSCLEDQIKKKENNIQFKDQIIHDLRRKCKKLEKHRSKSRDDEDTTEIETNRTYIITKSSVPQYP